MDQETRELVGKITDQGIVDAAAQIDPRTGRPEPFPEIRDPRSGPLGYFNTSQIGRMVDCSFSYELEFERGLIPEYRSGRAVRGVVIHKMIAELNEPGVAIDKERLNNLWTEEIAFGGPPVMWGKDHPDQLKEEAWAILRNYAKPLKEEIFFRETHWPVGELPFYCFVGGYLFKSTVDQIRKYPGDIYRIIDLKTDKDDPPDAYLARNMQLSLYGYAAWKGALEPCIPAGTIPELWWYQLYKHLPYKKATGNAKKGDERGDPWFRVFREEADLQRFEWEVKRIAKAIRFKAYYPQPRKVMGCNTCRFAGNVCPRPRGHVEEERKIRALEAVAQAERELETKHLATLRGET